MAKQMSQTALNYCGSSSYLLKGHCTKLPPGSRLPDVLITGKRFYLKIRLLTKKHLFCAPWLKRGKAWCAFHHSNRGYCGIHECSRKNSPSTSIQILCTSKCSSYRLRREKDPIKGLLQGWCWLCREKSFHLPCGLLRATYLTSLFWLISVDVMLQDQIIILDSVHLLLIWIRMPTNYCNSSMNFWCK